MKTAIALPFLLAVASAAYVKFPVPIMGRGIGGRIVGGTEASTGEFPWQVSWRAKSWLGYSHSCGGSILNSMWILSAGHCCNGISQGKIVAGGLSLKQDEGIEQERTYTEFIHPNYNPSTTNNDVCLLKLNEPLDLSDPVNFSTIKLDTSGQWEEGSVFNVTGWGTTSAGGSISDKLLKVQVPLVDQKTCQDDYSQFSITDAMICAGEKGRDSCQGDSGGPMVAIDEQGSPVLVGVVSWGIGCAQEGYPGVYARVSQFVDWINDTMENN